GNATISSTGVLTIANNAITTARITAGAVDLTTKVSGTLPIVNGGTNATTANAALNNLLPSKGGSSGKFLTTDGTNTSWSFVGGGPVTGVTASAPLSSSGGAAPHMSLSGIV